MTKEPKLDPDRFRAVFLLLLVLGISLLFLEMIRPFFVALLLAALFSGMAHPAYRRIERRFRGRRGLASITTLLLFFLLLLVPLGIFLGIVANQAVQVSEAVAPWIQEHARREEIEGLIFELPFAELLRPYQEQITARIAEAAGQIGGFVVTRLAALTRGTVNFLFLLFVMLYSMFFFLKDGGRILQRILYYMPLSDTDEHRMLGKFLSVTRAMIKGTFLIGIVQGGLAGIAFVVAGLPAAAFWGTVMAVLSIIPAIGSGLVWGPASIYLLAIGRVGAGIGLLVWGIVVVSSVDNVMRPWLVGRDTQMSDLLVLLGVLGGLALFGAAGVLIGPIVAALFVTVWELYGEAFREILPAARLPEDPAPAGGAPTFTTGDDG